MKDGPMKAMCRGFNLAMRKHVRVVAVLVVMSLLVASLPASSGRTQRLGRQNNAPASSQPSLPVQLYRSVGNTLASLGGWFAAKVRPNSPAPAATTYLSPEPPFIDAPTNLTVTAASSSGINLSWTAPAGGVDHYQLERSENMSGPFSFVANVTGTTKNDTSITNLHAYLYRVRAVSGSGAVSAPSNMALGTAISFQFSSLQGQEIRKEHFYDVRTAINLVRPLANLPAYSWARGNLAGLEVKADDVNEMRTALNAALNALLIPVTAYDDPTLNVGANGTFIRGIHIEQLQTRSTRGSSTSFGPPDADSSNARLDPLNETGGGGDNPLSRNFNWNLPLVNLPGRSGMNLNLSLSYNSLVWTKIGTSTISFDDDNSSPAPGFRLGFPVIQPSFFNSAAGKNAFLLIDSDGKRSELRQVGTSLYQAVDSSYLLFNSSTMTLRSPDGTQLTYVSTPSNYQCTKIKDRNGNFITINYDTLNRIDTIVDTLTRTIKFNYTGSDLTSITETWTVNSQQQSTTWATFTYANQTIQTNFSGLTVAGPPNNTIRALTRVTLPDNSHFDFEYTTWGQVRKIRKHGTDDHLLNYRTYNLPLDSSEPQTECPRFSERRDWAENWNRDVNGTAEEALTTFAAPSTVTIPGTSLTGKQVQVTAPDLTSQKIYYGSLATSPGWQNGLVLLTETYDSSATKQRWAATTWTQDDTNAAYQLNPRVAETNLHDSAGNQARTRTYYATFNLLDTNSCRYPQDIYEYAANATTVLRRKHIDYNMTDTYTSRRILGLPSANYLCDGAQGEVPCSDTSGTSLLAKQTFQYDEAGSIQGSDTPVQHDDANYGTGLLAGRANISSVKRYDVVNTGQPTINSVQYNTAGSVVKMIDAATHQTQISYTDQFSANGTTLDSGLPTTLAYPTTVTDPGSFTIKNRYNYQFGAPTWKQTPLPNTVDNLAGPQTVWVYDTIGRLERVKSLVNNAYTRYIYGPNYLETFATTNNVADEAHALEVFDGHGRVIAKASNHPGSDFGFSGQLVIYDVMGRVFKQSNPTETSITISGTPIQPYSWPASGDDQQNDWLYTQQTYDWKGRPRITTNPDDSYTEASYTGCGCAGGEVVTLTDEVGRQQKIYSDVLGRQWKTEILNSNGTVYSTIVNTFNARDQVTNIRQWAGVENGTGTHQDTTMGYDGYGRLQSKHMPNQDASTSTVYAYNADDTTLSVTDSRGASATYGYNSRHLVTGVTYDAPAGVASAVNLTYEYDAAGNRTLMTDAVGSVTYNYDQLSRLTSETRQFTDSIPQAPLANNRFTISYEYNLADQLKKLTAPYGEQFNYTLDSIGRITQVTGPLFSWSSGQKNYVSNIKYRAWGGVKSADYPNANGFLPTCNVAGMSLTQAFDKRLRSTSHDLRVNASQFCTGGSLLKKEYEYFDDNRLSYVRDVLNGAFDRSQEYDHAGRLIHVKTGAEAQGVGPLNFYRQNFSYDEFGNTLSRQAKDPNTDETQTYTYVNNRATSWVNNQPTPWQYDADGRVTNDTHTQYTNDASGAVITTQVTNEYIMGRVHDGDGLVAKQAVGQTTTGVPLYFVRSTVLGGKIITQLPPTAADGIPRTFVYALGTLVAKMEKTSFGGGPWEIVFSLFRDPSETTDLDDEGGYYTYRRMELDPTKAVVYDDYNPEAPPYSGGYLDTWTLGFLGVGGSQFGGASCFLDGFEANCGTVMRSLELDMADQCPSVDCGPAVAIIRGRDGSIRRALVPLSRDPNTGQLGYYPERWGILQKPKTTPNDPASLFKEFLKKNPECAKKVQAAGDKLGLGSYVNTPWTITDTYPALYDKPGIIPGQTDPKLTTPRNYFDAHPGWAATTLFDPQGNRAGTFLGELYHVYYRWNPDETPGSPVFISYPRGLRSKQLTLFDESLHNYFHMSHSELANALGVPFEGKDIDALMALEAWAKRGCK